MKRLFANVTDEFPISMNLIHVMAFLRDGIKFLLTSLAYFASSLRMLIAFLIKIGGESGSWRVFVAMN